MIDKILIPLNLSAFFTAAAASYLLVFLCIKLSFRYNCLDHPVGRKTHARPMPYLGGVAVFTAFWGITFAGIGACHFFPVFMNRVEPSHWFVSGVLYLTPKIFGIFLGSVVILLLGLFDDKYRWPPLTKLFGQMLAAWILMSMGLNIDLAFKFGLFGHLITFVWILLIINAFNFIDSLDGHMLGVALISSVMFIWITQIIGQAMVGLFHFVFAGAVLGLLIHNFKPAKIYAGDNGSLFIGYMMAAFTLLGTYRSHSGTYITSFIPILIFGVPIYDTLSVIVVRLARGIPPWTGDRNHFAHRLVKIGMGDRVAVIFSYFITFTVGTVAVLATQVELFGAVLIAIIFLSIIATIAFLEFYTARRIRIAEEAVLKHTKPRLADTDTHGA